MVNAMNDRTVAGVRVQLPLVFQNAVRVIEYLKNTLLKFRLIASFQTHKKEGRGRVGWRGEGDGGHNVTDENRFLDQLESFLASFHRGKRPRLKKSATQKNAKMQLTAHVSS